MAHAPDDWKSPRVPKQKRIAPKITVPSCELVKTLYRQGNSYHQIAALTGIAELVPKGKRKVNGRLGWIFMRPGVFRIGAVARLSRRHILQCVGQILSVNDPTLQIFWSAKTENSRNPRQFNSRAVKQRLKKADKPNVGLGRRLSGSPEVSLAKLLRGHLQIM